MRERERERERDRERERQRKRKGSEKRNGIVQRREDGAEANAEIKMRKGRKRRMNYKGEDGDGGCSERGEAESCRTDGTGASGNSRQFVRVERTMRGRASGKRRGQRRKGRRK